MAEKKERPTFEIHFHDKVGQNINHIDNMHVQFDKDMTMQIGQVDEMHVDGEAVGVENGTTTERKGAGRPAEVLFADERLSAQEASRVKKFVEDNMLLGVKWNTSKGNTVRKMVVCFYKKWEELGFVGEAQFPSSAAVVNFFVNECGISPNVSVDTLKNNTKPWQEEIDEDMMEIVCAIFPQ